MLTPRRGAFVAGISVCIFAAGIITAQPAISQFTDSSVPESIARGDSANVFATWGHGRAVDGFEIELPDDLTIESATVLRNSYVPVALNVQPLEGSRFVIKMSERLETTAELVLRVRSGDTGGTIGAEGMYVTPFVTNAAAGLRTMFHADRLSFTLRTDSGYEDPQNRVISFAAADARPLLLRADGLPPLDLRHAFALSFWLKTTGLNEVLFSTWDGARDRPYPLEIVIDPAGRLRSFRGRPGEHQSIGSKAPVADGAWHRIEVTNQPETGWMRLKVDDRVVDSLLSAGPLPIAADLAPAIGGRVPGENTYFDGTTAYSGQMDEMRINSVDPTAGSDRAARRESLRLDFDDEIPVDVFRESPHGVRLTRSNLTVQRPVIGFQAVPGDGQVVLEWQAQDSETLEFVVERSRDGKSFEVVQRLAGSAYPTDYEYSEPAAGEGVAYFRLRQIFAGGFERISGTIKVGLGVEQPEQVTLVGNFPNPFNGSTTISYSVTEPSQVDLSVWDLSGQPVRQLLDRDQGRGFHEMQFDAGDLPSGTYFIRLETPSGTKSHKMILMR